MELLPDWSAFARWLRAANVLDGAAARRVTADWSGRAAARRALDRFREFREALRNEVLRIEGGSLPSRAFVDALNRLLREHPTRTEVYRDGQPFQPPSAGKASDHAARSGTDQATYIRERPDTTDLKAEGESNCAIEVERSGTAVKLSITHTMDRDASKLIVAVSGGQGLVAVNNGRGNKSCAHCVSPWPRQPSSKLGLRPPSPQSGWRRRACSAERAGCRRLIIGGHEPGVPPRVAADAVMDVENHAWGFSRSLQGRLVPVMATFLARLRAERRIR
jgi:hypothetical protein